MLTLLAVAASFFPARASAGDPGVIGLRVEGAGDDLRVSYSVENAFSDEILERIQSGMRVAFRHRIELYAKRAVPLWFPKTLSWTVVETAVEFDGLTKQYHLSRSYRLGRKGKAWEGPAPIADEERDTDSLDVVRIWMSEVDGVPLLPVVSDVPVSRRRVDVNCSMGRKFVWMMFPVTVTASAESTLED
jgi:hypothetical protein